MPIPVIRRKIGTRVIGGKLCLLNQECGEGWYLVHMGQRPRDISSGILTIERLITEAYEG